MPRYQEFPFVITNIIHIAANRIGVGVNIPHRHENGNNLYFIVENLGLIYALNGYNAPIGRAVDFSRQARTAAHHATEKVSNKQKEQY